MLNRSNFSYSKCDFSENISDALDVVVCNVTELLEREMISPNSSGGQS
jgi:hypothetical protein